jgi:hypothetical protein
MSEFLLIAIVAVSTLVGVAGVLIYLLLGNNPREPLIR